MKKKLLNYLVIAVLSLGFVSCGDDEEPRDPNRPTTVDKTTVLTYNVIIVADAEYKLPKTLKLSEIVPQYSQYVYKGQLQNNSSNVKVTGLSNVPGSPELKNFTLGVKNTTTTVNLGSIKSDTTISVNDALNFMQNSVNQLVNQKEIEVSVSFTSATNINASEGVKVELNYHTTFSLE